MTNTDRDRPRRPQPAANGLTNLERARILRELRSLAVASDSMRERISQLTAAVESGDRPVSPAQPCEHSSREPGRREPGSQS